MDEQSQQLSQRMWREMELAPLAGRYLDERQAGKRTVDDYEDLLAQCSDKETLQEAVDLFGFIDVILRAQEDSAVAFD